MSLFSKTPLQHIDYDIKPSEWSASPTSTSAKLSFERMKHKDADIKRQQKIREKPWYVDIPYYLKDVVPDGNTFKIADVGDQIQGRFYGKTPEDAKQTFEVYYKLIKDNETKKLQQKLKELKTKQVIKATETAQAILADGNPQPVQYEITEALSQGDINPSALNTSPFGNLQVNSISAPTQRTTQLTAANIEARKAASRTRKAARKQKAPVENTTPLPEAKWSSSNVNALASQKAMASSAERALQSPSSVTNPMAFQRNKLRAAMKSTTGSSPKASRTLNKRQTSLAGYGPASKTKLQTRKRQTLSQNPQIASLQKSVASAAMNNANLNQQISTMFN